MCPVAGCSKGPFSRLSNHLKTVHHRLSEADRKLALKDARVVKQSKTVKYGPLIRGQKPITAFTRKRVLPPEEGEENPCKRGTQGFPTFPLGSGAEIDRLTGYLQSVDGQCRPLREAEQVIQRPITLNPIHYIVLAITSDNKRRIEVP